VISLLVRIDERVTVSEDELRFTASRSAGPGGQHVNKANTRVTLWFDVERSPSLDNDQRRRIRSRLATRINRDGVLRVACQRHRSQAANRREAIERFVELVRAALRRPRPRRKTAVPPEERHRRVEAKRRRGRIKRDRRTGIED
jgi:ribosome-associated protein